MSLTHFSEVLALPSFEDKPDCACFTVAVNWRDGHRVFSCGCGDFRISSTRTA
ncbi:hypothetical protein NONI108955_11180 [Nocardia ninae]